MPIKFRCQHCRQFLGISRAKAGEIFDCPTCGWTLRVPELDGTIRPLPGPGLNLEDSKLAEALDELASMDSSAQSNAIRSAARSAGGTGVEGRVIDDRKGADESSVEASSFGLNDELSDNSENNVPDGGIRTMAEPIELGPLPPPERISIEPNFRARKPVPPAKSEDESRSEGSPQPWKSTAPGGNSWRRLLAAAEFDLAEGDSTDEPVKEADPLSSASVVVPAGEAIGDIAAPVVTEASGTLWPGGSTLFAMAGIAAAVFASGFWLGRVTTLPTVAMSSEAAAESPVENSDSVSSSAASDESISGHYSAFRGRITYRTETGERKPDQGARVIVLPVERRGTARLSATGLWGGDQPEDQQFARSGIRALGGDVAVANDSGEFEIKLPGSGQYYILALSNSLSGEESADGEVEKALASYFERPSQLLGRVMHHFEEARYTGDGATPWDYSFSQQ